MYVQQPRGTRARRSLAKLVTIAVAKAYDHMHIACTATPRYRDTETCGQDRDYNSNDVVNKRCRTFLTPKAVFKTALGVKKVRHILLTTSSQI